MPRSLTGTPDTVESLKAEMSMMRAVMRDTKWVGLTVLLGAAVGCADELGSGVDGAPVVVSDSAGIRMITVPETAVANADTWALETDPEIVFDVGERSLYRVYAGAFLPDRSVVVTNAGEELLLFGADGGLERVIGGLGDGPGEFQMLTSVSAVGDSIFVFDRVGGILQFDRFGAFVGRTRIPFMPSHEVGAAGRSFVFGRVGTIPMEELAKDEVGLVYNTSHLFRLSMPTGNIDTLLTTFGNVWLRVRRNSLSEKVYLPKAVLAFNGGEGAIYSWTGGDRLWEYSADGQLATVLTLAGMRRQLLNEERWCTEMRLGKCVGGLEDGGTYTTALPDSLPLAVDVMLFSDGQLWIQEIPEGLDDVEQRWIMFSRERIPVGHISVSERVRILDVLGDQVLVVRRDALDVETLEVYRVRRAGDQPSG